MNIAAMSRLVRVAETTQGVAPIDAAAWVASDKVLVRHLAETLDLSGVERAQLPDERNQTRVFANEAMVEGLDNPEFPFSLYGHGTGAVSPGAIDDDPTVTPGIELFRQLEQAIGGLTLGTSTTTSGGASTVVVIDVTDASTYEPGDFVAVGLTTNLPSKYPAGTAFPRRILAVDTGGAPHNITLDQALPGIPVDTDPVHGCAVVYPDETILCDSNGAGGPFTWTYLGLKGLPSATADRREAWEFPGTVQTLQSFTFERGGALTFGMSVMAGSHKDPSAAPWPAFLDAEQGLAPLSIGPLTEVWLEDDGTDTNTEVQVSSFEVEPGVPRNRVETVTSAGDTMQGTASYATSPAETTITMSLTPFGIAQWTEQNAKVEKQLRWARLGPAGSGFAVSFPRVSYMKTPGRNVNDAVSESLVTFLAHEDNDIAPVPANNNRWKAKLAFIGW
jgi:hypothetical protein